MAAHRAWSMRGKEHEATGRSTAGRSTTGSSPSTSAVVSSVQQDGSNDHGDGGVSGEDERELWSGELNIENLGGVVGASHLEKASASVEGEETSHLRRREADDQVLGDEPPHEQTGDGSGAIA